MYTSRISMNQLWLIDMATFEVGHVAASPASPASQVFVNNAHHSEQREANKFQDLSTKNTKTHIMHHYAMLNIFGYI